MQVVIKSNFGKEVKQVSNLELNEVIRNYKGLILSNDKALKEETLKAYIKTGSYFIDFIREYGLNFHSLKMYRMYLAGLEKATTTKNTYLTAAKNICKNAYANQLISFQIFDVELFKQSKEHTKDGLEIGEVKSLLQYVDTIKKDSRKMKAKLMIYLLAFQGLRESELVKIKVSDIDLKNETITIKGKGRDDKENISILHTGTVQLLEQWITFNKFCNDCFIFSPKTKPSKSVSTAYVREFFTGNWKTIKGEKRRIKGLFDRCNIVGKSVHGFRHFFVTWLLEQGYTLSEVQKFSRHRTFETIKVYDDRRIKKSLSKKIKKGFSTMF